MHVVTINNLNIGDTYFFIYDGLLYHAECCGVDVPETFEVKTHLFNRYICDVIHTSLIFQL